MQRKTSLFPEWKIGSQDIQTNRDDRRLHAWSRLNPQRPQNWKHFDKLKHSWNKVDRFRIYNIILTKRKFSATYRNTKTFKQRWNYPEDCLRSKARRFVSRSNPDNLSLRWYSILDRSRKRTLQLNFLWPHGNSVPWKATFWKLKGFDKHDNDW